MGAAANIFVTFVLFQLASRLAVFDAHKAYGDVGDVRANCVVDDERALLRGVANGSSEDIVHDVDHARVLFSSLDLTQFARNVVPRAPGGVFARALEAPYNVHRCAVRGFDERALLPHGLDMLPRARAGKNGAAGDAPLLFVVNHGTPDGGTAFADIVETVEVFAAAADDTGACVLTHVRTVRSPDFTSLNDVAAIDAERFYVTNDSPVARRDMHARPWLELATLLAHELLHSTTVVFVGPGDRSRVVASGLHSANGIVVLEPRAGVRLLLVSAAADKDNIPLFAIDERNDYALRRRGHINVWFAADNLHRAADDGSVYIGAHPSLFKILAALLSGSPAPSGVYRVRFDDGAFTDDRYYPAYETPYSVDAVYIDAESAVVDSSSVALPVGDRLFVGSVMGPGVECTRWPGGKK